jgi:hypothetical protein
MLRNDDRFDREVVVKGVVNGLLFGFTKVVLDKVAPQVAHLQLSVILK